MISGFEVYRTYQSIRVHFQGGKYDYTKSRIPISKFGQDAFNNRRDRYQYEKLGKSFNSKLELEEFCASLFYEMGSKQWIGDAGRHSLQTYKTHRSYTNQLHYCFRRDLVEISQRYGLSVAFRKIEGMPFIFKLIGMQKGQNIVGSYLHTFTLVNRQVNICKVYDDFYPEDSLYWKLKTPIERFGNFVTLNTVQDLKEVRSTFLDLYKTEENI